MRGFFLRPTQAAECFDRHQPFDAVADRGGEAGAAGAHRMAEQAETVPAQCIGHIKHVADRGGRGVAGAVRQMRAVAMAGQIDPMQGEPVRQALHQRCEHAALQGPAMEQNQVRPTAGHFNMHGQRRGTQAKAGSGGGALSRADRATWSRALAMASTRPRTWSGECSADRVTRRRALPSGTVGGRIAPTSQPACSSARDIATAEWSSPHSNGWIGVSEAIRSSPWRRASLRNSAIRSASLERRQWSRRARRTASSAAAAIAGGTAVV
ncbi:hypothetical protein G6F66_013469 [Rhizopus arrhizus]|nr:hypothetical protein G6F66_013469 [Rhizopus arrhizus]